MELFGKKSKLCFTTTKGMSRLAIKFLGMRRVENACVWYNEIYYREKYQTTNVSEW